VVSFWFFVMAIRRYCISRAWHDPLLDAFLAGEHRA
jgi:hypothetical protein